MKKRTAGRKIKILIAEDDDEVREVYKQMLNNKYALLEAKNGREAVEKYISQNPDLVLMDINMPLKTGKKAIEEILEYDPEAKIIAVTAYAYTWEELGVEVLRKGFSRKVLLERIKRKLNPPD